jgi:hypothetical protein
VADNLAVYATCVCTYEQVVYATERERWKAANGLKIHVSKIDGRM